MTRTAWLLHRVYHTLYPFRRPLVLAIYGGVAALSYALTYEPVLQSDGDVCGGLA